MNALNNQSFNSNSSLWLCSMKLNSAQNSNAIYDYFIPIISILCMLEYLALLISIRLIHVVDCINFLLPLEMWAFLLVIHYLIFGMGFNCLFRTLFYSLDTYILLSVFEHLFSTEHSFYTLSIFMLILAELRFFLGLYSAKHDFYLSSTVMTIWISLFYFLFMLIYILNDFNEILVACYTNESIYFVVNATPTSRTLMFTSRYTYMLAVLFQGLILLFIFNIKTTVTNELSTRRSFNNIDAKPSRFQGNETKGFIIKINYSGTDEPTAKVVKHLNVSNTRYLTKNVRLIYSENLTPELRLFKCIFFSWLSYLFHWFFNALAYFFQDHWTKVIFIGCETAVGPFFGLAYFFYFKEIREKYSLMVFIIKHFKLLTKSRVKRRKNIYLQNDLSDIPESFTDTMLKPKITVNMVEDNKSKIPQMLSDIMHQTISMESLTQPSRNTRSHFLPDINCSEQDLTNVSPFVDNILFTRSTLSRQSTSLSNISIIHDNIEPQNQQQQTERTILQNPFMIKY